MAALVEIRARILADFPEQDSIAQLILKWRGNGLARQGISPCGVEYLFHGIGCRLIDERGREVDVDLLKDQAGVQVEAFDAWRVRHLSEANEAVQEESLNAACSALAAKGELREVTAGRWYALPAVQRHRAADEVEDCRQ